MVWLCSVVRTSFIMKTSSLFPLVCIVVVLVCFVRNASAIFCYDCNSAYDPRCGEEFDSFSLGVVNCSLRDPPEHIPADLEPTLCRTIKMEIYGKTRVVRSCGYIHEENETIGEPTCRRQTGNGELFVTYCSCDTDLCNSGVMYQTTVWFSAILAICCMLCYEYKCFN